MPDKWESLTRVSDGLTFKVEAVLQDRDETGLRLGHAARPHVSLSLRSGAITIAYPMMVRNVRTMANNMLRLADLAEKMNDPPLL